MKLNKILIESTDTNLFEQRIQDLLKSIRFVEKVEVQKDIDFDGMYIIIVHIDKVLNDIPEGPAYVKMRSKLKHEVLACFKELGLVNVDPPEDNSSYLYYVVQQKQSNSTILEDTQVNESSARQWLKKLFDRSNDTNDSVFVGHCFYISNGLNGKLLSLGFEFGSNEYYNGYLYNDKELMLVTYTEGDYTLYAFNNLKDYINKKKELNTFYINEALTEAPTKIRLKDSAKIKTFTIPLDKETLTELENHFDPYELYGGTILKGSAKIDPRVTLHESGPDTMVTLSPVIYLKILVKGDFDDDTIDRQWIEYTLAGPELYAYWTDDPDYLNAHDAYVEIEYYDCYNVNREYTLARIITDYCFEDFIEEAEEALRPFDPSNK